jgi:hypothetical protein
MVAELVASDTVPGDGFADSLSLDGKFLLVGARDHNDGAGAAYVFRRERAGWTEEAKLTASDAAAGHGFGVVAISGDHAIVGAPQTHAAPHSGAAYIFRRTSTGWVQQAKLTASDATANDYFGEKVAISGKHAVVGAVFADSPGGRFTGAAYVFRRRGTTWLETAKLTASDAAPFDFYRSVSISRDYILLGAPGDDDAGDDSGSAYIFHRRGRTWVEQAKLMGGSVGPGDSFGQLVSLSGDCAVVAAPTTQRDGEPAVAYVFRRNGTDWAEEVVLGVGEAWDVVVDVSTNREYVLIIAVLDNAISQKYLYKHTGRTWTKVTSLPGSSFGHCSVGDNFAAIGTLERAAFVYCLPVCAAVCGDGVCDVNEDMCKCPTDCRIPSESDDCNDNDLPDECDQSGDVDGNGRVNIRDHSGFCACITGPSNRRRLGASLNPDSCCQIVEFDGDNDVDLQDFAKFQLVFVQP